MIWSLVKILFFIAIAAGLAYGAGFVLETPGEVRIAFAGREVNLTPLGFLIGLVVLMLAVWIILLAAGFCVAVVRTLLGDSTAIMRYLDRSRERKGFDALSKSVTALAAGDTRMAQLKAQKAEKLLNRPELTSVIHAQAAEAAGNKERAAQIYKKMLKVDESRFLGIQGLMKQQLDSGNTDTALKLAEKAFSINPRSQHVLDTLFDLQSKSSDWAGAKATLSAKVRTNALPNDVGRRREAILALADALAAEEIEDMPRARESGYLANRLVPELVPAAALAGRLHARAGEGRQTAKIIKKAWAQSPHPDLAAAFAAIAPDEEPEARLKRFEPLLKLQPDHPETRMVAAELSLAAEDFPGARRALGDLAESDPTTRSLALMAAIEKGEGADDRVVRGWLARALSVPRGEAWICGNCNHVHSGWVPICKNCEAFDSLSWARPPETDQADSTAAAMLPLIVGALDAAEPANEPEEDTEEPIGMTDVTPEEEDITRPEIEPDQEPANEAEQPEQRASA